MDSELNLRNEDTKPLARGAQVFSGVPTWLRACLNKAFPAQTKSYIQRHGGAHRTRLGSKSEAWDFLANFSDYSGRDLWDHVGHSGEDLVSELYADRAEIEPRVAAFAAELGVKYSISEPSYHNPGHCLRIEFHEPEQR